MRKVATTCKELEFVNLSGCKYLSDSSICSLIENCPKIYHLNLTRIPKLSEKPFKLIAQLENLDYLNLYADADIKDQGFRDLAISPYHKLSFLDLCGCKYLTDDSVIALTQNFPNLTYLNLTWCVLLTDRSVTEGVTRHLTKLSLLSLYGLVMMTDKSVDALVQSPLKFTLETLDINGCREVTQNDEQILKVLFPNVKVLVFQN